MEPKQRKPRIALMGEFSAGKSTLSNLLLGARPLPERVTATRLSPVWISAGSQAPYRVTVDGEQEEVSVRNLGAIPVEETRVIRLFFETEILQHCDLIDFPGISDPNMSSEVWQRVLNEVDAVLWCTHATQAWRQSEASVWESFPQAVRERSALLVTRFDKLTTDRDRARVLARLAKETEGLFAGIFPISLTEALAAGEDQKGLEASGAIAFFRFFFDLVERLQGEVGGDDETIFAAHQPKPLLHAVEEPQQEAPRVLRRPMGGEAPEQVEVAPELEAIDDPKVTPIRPQRPAAAPGAIMPRRVRPEAATGRGERPRPASARVDMSAQEAKSPADTAASAAAAVAELRSIFGEALQKDGE